MKRIVFVMLALAGFTTPAFALSLSEARAQGKVCEKGDGYIAAVDPSAEVRTLVASVNAGRKTYYEGLAKEKNQSVAVVAKVAGGTLISEGNAACK